MTRVAAIDEVRGVSIVSMLFGHFADSTLLSKLLHLPLWIDGAMGFVMVSGIVIGIVRHRNLTSGASLATVSGRTWRRAGQLWLIFCVITLSSLALRDLTGRGTVTPDVDQLGGWSKVIANTLAMQVSLRYVDLLTLYVFILLVTPISFWLLQQRRGVVLLGAATVGVYLLDVAVPLEALRLESVSTTDGVLVVRTVAVAARWLALFNIGLAIGWHWPVFYRWMSQRMVVFALAAAALGLTLLARGSDRLGWSPPTWLINKTYLAPGTLFFAVIGVVAAIAVLDRSTRSPRYGAWGAPARRALEGLGRISLAAYVIHLIVIQLTDLTVGIPTGPWLGLVLIGLTLIACYLWAATRPPPTGGVTTQATLARRVVGS